MLWDTFSLLYPFFFFLVGLLFAHGNKKAVGGDVPFFFFFFGFLWGLGKRNDTFDAWALVIR